MAGYRAMKWRLIDKLERYEPWRSVSGRKAVSFEEYSLLKPFGRKGDFRKHWSWKRAWN